MMDLRNSFNSFRKGKAQLEEGNFCLSKVLKGAKGTDVYLKDQFDFTGVKAALLGVEQIFWSFSEMISQIFLGQIHGSCQGGGREGQETNLECLQREVWGELGLTFDRGIDYLVENLSSMLDKDRSAVFVVGRISQEQYREIRFGDEGRNLTNACRRFIKAEGVIPQLQNALKTIYQSSKENNIWTNGKN